MSDINITKLDASSADFNQQLQNLLAWNETDDREIHQRVLDIIADVRKNGDKAVIEYTNRFDQCHVAHASELEFSGATLKSAWDQLPADQAQALQTAADRIRAYAE
ncbi:MAG: histidinol dehydrogenase, partial [Methylobacter sp.]